MKKLVKTAAAFLAGTMMMVLGVSSFNAATGVTVQNNVNTPGGKSINAVTISPSANRKPVLITAGGIVTTDTSMDNFIATAKGYGTVAAMVNGAYFEAYYKAGDARSVPNNCARTYGTLYKDGHPISSGSRIMLGFNKSGQWLIEYAEMEVSMTIAETKYGARSHVMWHVNEYQPSSYAITMFTPEVGMTVPMPAGSKGYVVKDGVCTQIITTEFLPAAGETIIVIGSDAQAGMDTWESGPYIGAKITFETKFTPSRATKAEAWKDMDIVVGAGPFLLQDGVNVADNAAYRKGFEDAKHQGAAQRTFIGVKADNTIVIGEGGCTYSDAAEYLKAQGCVDAMALDGGGSSFLYANDQTLNAAGRLLNNVIAIVDTSAAPVPSLVAKPTAQKVIVNSEDVVFKIYNINNNNYFRVRDLAAILSGTGAQFDVGSNSATKEVLLTTGKAYSIENPVLPAPATQNATPVLSPSKILIDGAAHDLTAYLIENNNYFKILELGKALDFYVKYDPALKAIVIDSTRGFE